MNFWPADARVTAKIGISSFKDKDPLQKWSSSCDGGVCFPNLSESVLTPSLLLLVTGLWPCNLHNSKRLKYGYVYQKNQNQRLTPPRPGGPGGPGGPGSPGWPGIPSLPAGPGRPCNGQQREKNRKMGLESPECRDLILTNAQTQRGQLNMHPLSHDCLYSCCINRTDPCVSYFISFMCLDRLTGSLQW